jgi:hypothetical protein
LTHFRPTLLWLTLLPYFLGPTGFFPVGPLCFWDLKTAKQIGLTSPPSVLAQADKVVK